MDSTFGWRYKNVWYNKHLKKVTKINVYRTIVLALWRSCDIYRYHLWLLERFHLCTLLNIHWRDFFINTKVLEKLKITNIEVMLLKFSLCRAGLHQDRKLWPTHPHTLLRTPCQMSRKRGTKEAIQRLLGKNYFGAYHFNNSWWSTRADKHDARCLPSPNHVISSFEDTQRAIRSTKDAGKGTAKEPQKCKSCPNQTFSYNLCNRTWLSHVGLISHERTCSWRGPVTSWCSFHEIKPWMKLYIYIYIEKDYG